MSAPKTRRAKRAEALSLPVQTFIKTQLLAAILYSGLFFAVSVVALSVDLPECYMFYACVLSLSAGSFVCAFYAAGKLHKNGMVTGLLFCLPFNTLVIIISLAVNSFKIDLSAAVAYFILVVTSMLSGIVAVNRKSKPKIRVK